MRFATGGMQVVAEWQDRTRLSSSTTKTNLSLIRNLAHLFAEVDLLAHVSQGHLLRRSNYERPVHATSLQQLQDQATTMVTNPAASTEGPAAVLTFGSIISVNPAGLLHTVHKAPSWQATAWTAGNHAMTHPPGPWRCAHRRCQAARPR